MRKYTTETILLFAILIGINENVFSQNQSKVDSLKSILEQNENLTLSHKISVLDKIAVFSTSPEEILIYADKLLKLATRNNLPIYSINAYRYQGVAYRLKGDLKQSLENLFLSAKMALNSNEYNLQVKAYLEIANTYTANNNFKNALHYENEAIEIVRVHGNKEQLAINLLNTGFSYYTLEELDSALLLYNEAEPIFEEINLTIGKAYTIGNRALVYWKQGFYIVAERDLLKAINMLEPLGDQFGMADYHNQLGKFYLEQNIEDEAIEHTQIALNMAEGLDLKEQARDAALLLSELYTNQEEYKKALDFQTKYMSYKNSIENVETTRKMADIRTEFEVSLKEKEIDLLEKRQIIDRAYILGAITLLVFSIVLLLYFRERFRRTKLTSIAEQKQHEERIEELLTQHETKALQSMIEGRDNERKRLAQEIHNHIGSLLATIKVNLNGMDNIYSGRHQTITSLVDQACNDVRDMSHTLNMGISEDFGLVPSLKELSAHLEKSGELEVEFAASMCEIQMDSENEILIYRIVQELVSNVLKHANATKLSVLLTCYEKENLINILVQDNGKGFDHKTVKSESDGMGINSLKEMVSQYQGDIKFDSNAISGTTVIIDLPINSEINPVML